MAIEFDRGLRRRKPAAPIGLRRAGAASRRARAAAASACGPSAAAALFECADCGPDDAAWRARSLEEDQEAVQGLVQGGVRYLFSAQRHSSAKELQRHSCTSVPTKTAWSLAAQAQSRAVAPLSESRSALSSRSTRPSSGERAHPHKELGVRGVAAKPTAGCVSPTPSTDERVTLHNPSPTRQIALGHPGRDRRARQLQQRKPWPTVLTRLSSRRNQERRESDALQGCHWTVSLSEALAASAHMPARSSQSTCKPTSTSSHSASTGARPMASAASPLAPSSSWSPAHRSRCNADPGSGALSSFPELTA